MINSGGDTSNNLVTGLFRRLIDLALQDDLLALDAAGLAAAVEEVDVAELPQRIGELASTWVAKALADVHEDDRAAAAQQLATELMATINRTTADPLIAQDETLASPISELTAIEPLDPTGNIIPIKRPLTPIGDTVLLTNARGEPAQDQTTDLTPFDITPYPFQKAMLEQLQVERRRGRPHSLVVAATGTGKTVMAALDYRHLRTQLDSAKLLFIAHRKEILRQSRTTFRHVLRNGSFGEEWVDGQTPSEWNHVFASIQSLAANGLDNLAVSRV